MFDYRKEICSHNEPYICPRCRQCFPCKHKRKEASDGTVWWVCPDGTMVRTGSSGEIVEQIKRR